MTPTPEQIEAERPYAIMIVGRSIPEISTALALTRLEGIATGRAQMEAEVERLKNEIEEWRQRWTAAAQTAQDLAWDVGKREDEIQQLQAKIEGATIAASETQPTWHHRCNKIMAALGYDYGDADWMMPDEKRRLIDAEEDIERLRAALEPFALVAEHDIGESETDEDFFSPMKTNNRAPRLTVGDLRRARDTLEGMK